MDSQGNSHGIYCNDNGDFDDIQYLILIYFLSLKYTDIYDPMII